MGLSKRASFFRTATLAAGAALMMNSVSLPSFAEPQTTAPVTTQHGPESVADLAAGLLDAVVNISTSQNVKNDDQAPMPQVPEGSPFQDFFDEFFKGQGGEGGNRQRTVNSLGSGFVIDPTGFIVTNNHVIEGADDIEVNFANGTQAEGQADRYRHEDRSCAVEGGAEEAADRGSVRRFPPDAHRRLGDGDRQSLRAWRHGDGRDHFRPRPQHQRRPL